MPPVKRPKLNRPIRSKRRKTKTKRGMVAPNFNSMMAIPHENPLDAVDYPDTNAEANAEVEISEALKRIKAEKKVRRDTFRVMTDPNFYIVVCFQSADQRDDFIAKAGWHDLGEPFVDGLIVADRMGVDIEPISLPKKKVRLSPKKLRAKERTLAHPDEVTQPF